MLWHRPETRERGCSKRDHPSSALFGSIFKSQKIHPSSSWPSCARSQRSRSQKLAQPSLHPTSNNVCSAHVALVSQRPSKSHIAPLAKALSAHPRPRGWPLPQWCEDHVFTGLETILLLSLLITTVSFSVHTLMKSSMPFASVSRQRSHSVSVSIVRVLCVSCFYPLSLKSTPSLGSKTMTCYGGVHVTLVERDKLLLR